MPKLARSASRSRRVALVALALPLLALACWTASGPLRAIPGANWPDPAVHAWGGIYYTYATNTDGFHVPVRSSTGTWSGVPLGWSAPSEAFPASEHPAWITDCGSGKHIWGPSVVRLDTPYGAIHYLYYSATIRCDGSPFGEHAIGVAFSTTGPKGPFHKNGDTPLHRDPWGRGAIDPEAFIDDDGVWYLLYSTDWGPAGRRPGVKRTIEGRRMTGPVTLESVNNPGAWNVLLEARADNWERGTVEGPSMVKHDGVYYLFYAGGNFDADYATNFALCGSPLAGCGRLTENPWMYDGWEGMNNPGGLDVLRLYVPSSGQWAYAGLFHEDEGGRRELIFTVLSPW
jgi:hypothetical protein